MANEYVTSMGLLVAVVAAFPAVAEKTTVPSRLMPFLCRNATVRESGPKVILVGNGIEGGTWIILGVDRPGPRQRFENGQINRAGTALVKYLQKITGTKPRVLRSYSAAGNARGPRIFLCSDSDPFKTFPELRDADGHGFVIAARQGPNGVDLHIASPSGTGTLFGTWFFLMNYAGVRLVGPGELGEVVPQQERLDIPENLYVFNPGPDYELRIWSGPSGFVTTSWLADAGGTQRYQYHHNMYRIYSPQRFGKSHPEYFTMKEGKYVVPLPNSNSAWQPTFSNPSVAQRAIEFAEEAFKERPDLKSISLSVNDGGGYSEADIRAGTVLPDGRASISATYYAYVNKVARGIKRHWPGKYVAFFPYGLVREPPPFKLEDNAIIFLLNEPKPLYKAWAGKVSHIGIYQWLYGMARVIPNHWPHAMQDYLRWVRAHGGKAFKGEAYSAWAQDGPKMWVLNNLLWNVDADVDALLEDFYIHAYGPEAAPAMARYFAQAEIIYDRRRTPEAYRITITAFPGERQFEYARPEDFAIMAAALKEAEQRARGPANRRRVELTTRCFRWGEFYWRQVHAIRIAGKTAVTSDADIQKILNAARSFYSLPKARDEYFKKYILTVPQYCFYAVTPEKTDPARAQRGFRWTGFDEAMTTGFRAITEFKKKTLAPRDVADYWNHLSAENPQLKPFAESQRLALLLPGKPLRNLVTNPSFEEPPGPPDPKARKKRKFVAGDWWIYHNRMINARVFLDREVKHSGAVSLTARGITDYSGLLRYIRVRNGARYRLSCWYRTSARAHGVFGIGLDIREDLPPTGEWARHERVFTFNNPEGKYATAAIILCLRRGASRNAQIWFDDVRLEMLAPDRVE